MHNYGEASAREASELGDGREILAEAPTRRLVFRLVQPWRPVFNLSAEWVTVKYHAGKILKERLVLQISS